MLNIKSELKGGQAVLFLISNVEYNDVMIKTMKALSGKNVCYVTANKTFDALNETFSKEKIKIDNVAFIDAISKSIKKVPAQEGQVYYISSPGAFTELSLVVGKFLERSFDYLIFDSITNLSIYRGMPICTKFLRDIVNKVKKGKTKAVFYAIGSKNDDLIKQMGSIMDKVVEVGETNEKKKL